MRASMFLNFLPRTGRSDHDCYRSSLKFDDPLSAEELAGLACEEEIESRLVLGERDWTLRHGPFQESDFTSLAENNWSLLVQSVDIYINAFKELQNLFTFIPKWRLEDVMVSFAVPGGGVGPHFDYYDVFLVQGSGQRRWRIGKKCQSNAKLQNNSGLALLNSFNTQQEIILSAGDVLYIPPQFAHWGEAISDSFCYSIGFSSTFHSRHAGRLFGRPNRKSKPCRALHK